MKSQMSLFSILILIFLTLGKIAQADTTSNTTANSPKTHPGEVSTSTHLTRNQIEEALQLTALQKKQVRMNRANYRVHMAKLESQIKIANVELGNELDQPVPSSSKIDTLTAQIGVLYGKCLNVKVKASLNLENKILTPQQSDELKSLELKQNSTPDEIL